MRYVLLRALVRVQRHGRVHCNMLCKASPAEVPVSTQTAWQLAPATSQHRGVHPHDTCQTALSQLINYYKHTTNPSHSRNHHSVCLERTTHATS